MGILGDPTGEVLNRRFELVGIRPRRDRRLLRATQLRRRDHLHRLGDLLRAAHRSDAPADGFEACHYLTKTFLNSSITSVTRLRRSSVSSRRAAMSCMS